MKLDKFKDLIARPGVTVAYFSHDACNVCKVLKPQVQELTENYDNAHFIYVNTLETPEIAGQFMVFAVPTIILFMAGREAKRFSRNLAIGELDSFLERLTEME